jgi:peptide/nickel transport system substrate-binding protein
MKRRVFLGLAIGGALAASARGAMAQKTNDTLRVAWGGDGVMVSADNYYGQTRAGVWFCKTVFDTLIDRDPVSGEYLPNLATEWKWADDTTLEMRLRQGVKFHNGQPFNAEDVAFTFNTLAAPNSGVKFRHIIDWVDHVEKVDDFTIRIHSKGTFPQALAFLAGPMPVYPAQFYKDSGTAGMAKHPIGSGPYKVVEMKPAEAYTLVRNDDYTWGSPRGMAKIKNLNIREIPDVQTQVAELISGGIDLTADLTVDLANKLKGTSGVTTKMAETLRVFYMGFDAMGRSGSKPMQDVRVRQALSYAVNRQAIVDNLMGGKAHVLDTPCHPEQFGCVASAAVHYPYDPAKAKHLLADAGYKDGFDVDFYADEPAYEAEAIMADFAKVGVRANLRRLPWEAYHSAQLAGKTPIYIDNWGSSSLTDAAASISIFFSGSEDDFARDPDVISWLKTADSSTDPEKRKEYYGKAIKRISEQAYWLPTFSGVRAYGANAELNFTPRVDEMLRFYEYSWA